MGTHGILNAYFGAGEDGSLMITQMPNKTFYINGETLDLTGIKVMYITSIGNPIDVSEVIETTPAQGEIVPYTGGETTKIQVRYQEAYADFEVGIMNPVAWSSGSAEDILKMVQLSQSGLLNLKDYWTVGQERTVELTNGTSKQFVLVDKTLTGISAADAGTTLTFAVAVKDNMGNRQHHTSNTNNGGWRDSDIRAWCNGGFLDLLPGMFNSLFAPFKWKTGAGGGASSGLLETTDTFAIPAEKMLFGSRTYSFNDEAALYDQFEYYKTASHRVNSQWEASPRSGDGYNFCYVYYNGYADLDVASGSYAVVPFGCI